MISELQHPLVILTLAKIAFLVVLGLALTPLVKSATHRAALWSVVILGIPPITVFAFFPSQLDVIPTSKKASAEEKLLGTKIPSAGKIPKVSAEAPPSQTTSRDEIVEFPSIHSLEPPANSSSKFQTTTPEETPFPVLPAIYLLGVALTLLPMSISMIRLTFLSKSSASGRPLTLWKELSGGSESPTLHFTPSPSAPFACGVFRRRIFLPANALKWTDRRLKSALLHERAHLERRDPLVRFLASMVRAVFWFHPFVWVAHRQLVLAQEQACDQVALAAGIMPADYAEDLLGFVTASKHLPAESLAMARWSQLGKRVRSVLASNTTSPQKRLTPFVGGALLFVVALASTGFAEDPVAAEVPEIEKMKEGRGDILTKDGEVIAGGKLEQRTYPMGESAAHLAGYARHRNAIENKPAGISGLEASMDDTLSKGQPIVTTIDSKIQKMAYAILAKNEKPGSVVVSDPRTGAILALASWPSFDNNQFVPYISNEKYDKLISDERKPLFDRAVNASCGPGSTAKLITALAGEYAGLHNPEIHSEGFVQYGQLKIRDWKSNRDELLTIPTALESSCNTYFMQLANRAGYQAMKDVGNLLHLGEPMLSELRTLEAKWLEDPEEKGPVYIAMASLGQGHTQMSPLDVNAMTSAIATGTWRQPHLVFDEAIMRASQALVGQGEITEESLQLIRQGMIAVVQGERGTARRAQVRGHVIAGKTGTAQIGKGEHQGWFTGFAPAEDPRFVITFSIEKVDSAGQDVAPLAAELFAFLLKK